MEDLPEDVKAFLQNHPFLQFTDNKKIKCTLNGHDFPCNLKELQNFTKGKKYQKLSAAAEFNYSQYEPHVVPSTKQPNQLFCKLTIRHLNRLPHHVLRHVNGKRFKRALERYEECVQQGTEFIPARLKQKKPKGDRGEGEKGPDSRHGNSMWEPSSSGDEDHSDSDDSMSDLYPSSVFTLKNEGGGEEGVEDNGEEDEEDEDDFQTDDDEVEVMEVDKQAQQKRKKVQGGGFQKKFKNNKWKRSFKKRGNFQNVK